MPTNFSYCEQIEHHMGVTSTYFVEKLGGHGHRLIWHLLSQCSNTLGQRMKGLFVQLLVSRLLIVNGCHQHFQQVSVTQTGQVGENQSLEQFQSAIQRSS
jgi:hypothetical protein